MGAKHNSYGGDSKQCPTLMGSGAFVWAAELSADILAQGDPGLDPHGHAFNASGEEIYNQQKDPQFPDQP